MRLRALRYIAGLTAAVLLLAGCAAPPSSAASIGDVAPKLPTPITAPPTAPPALPTAAPQASSAPAPAQLGPPAYSYQVLQRYPHDPAAWTQGLVYVGDDTLYEGTGDYQLSSLRKVRLATGEVLQQVGLGNPTLYGEGIAVVGETIFQLTWQNCIGLLYDRGSFANTGQFSYPQANGTCAMEGWGLTYDGAQLIMSDGTSTLSFIDPAATAQSGQLAIVRQVQVTRQGQPLNRLNELEYIKGSLFANIWMTNTIVQIDPEYAIHSADRGTPTLVLPDPQALGMRGGISLDLAMVGFTFKADTDLAPVRFALDPSLPAFQGTRRLEPKAAAPA